MELIGAEKAVLCKWGETRRIEPIAMKPQTSQVGVKGHTIILT